MSKNPFGRKIGTRYVWRGEELEARRLRSALMRCEADVESLPGAGVAYAFLSTVWASSLRVDSHINLLHTSCDANHTTC